MFGVVIRRAALLAFATLVTAVASFVYASSELPPSAVEPALRDLWTGGSERFHRQWLIAGPVNASVDASIDPASLKPAVGEPLTERDPSVRWAAHTAWTDITELSSIPGRAVKTDDSVDRYVYVAGSFKRQTASSEELSIGSERAYSLWVNGEQIYSRSTVEGFAPDRDRVPVQLKQGENLVLLRIHESSIGTSQFSLRAVVPGAALPRIQQIAPALLASANSELVIRTHFASEPHSASVEVVVTGAGGSVVARSNAQRGEVVRFDARKWRDGAYEVRLSTLDEWKRQSVRYLPWYKGDAVAAVRRLIEVAGSAKQDVHGDTVRMLAAMAKDRLGGSIDKASQASWRLVHSALIEFEELQLDAARRQGSVRSDGFVRLAYVDEVDGSTQFCRAYLPSDYSSQQRWPLVTFLHGFNPANPEYIDWWSVDERYNPIAAEKGTIVLEPHARGNAQYLGIGERDVLRCIEEAQRRFSVHENRVYLTGESMGGHGTWSIASRHPDLFAAAAPVYGGWDFRVTSVSGPPTAATPQTVLDAYSLERASSFANAENLLHVPMLVVHGDVDAAVNVENSRHAVRLLQRWGYDIRYHEMPGWAHEDLGQRANIVDWLLTHERVESPETVRLRSPDLAGASAYWVRVRAFENPAEVIRVSAQVLRPGYIRVDSTNVAALALELPKSLRGSSNTIQIVWNGKLHELAAENGSVELGSAPSSIRKAAGLEGPLPALIATPFVVVVGTISTDARMRELIQNRADLLAQQWLGWQKHPLRVLKDTDISAEHESRYSLILLGGADANVVTRRFSNRLPFSASNGRIVIDGREWNANDAVLQAIYPSPAAADRYVYVVAPSSAAGMYFWKPQFVHFRQGYPLTVFDWVIQDGRRPPPGTMNPSAAFVASGVFDATWRHQARWTSLRDEAVASEWTLRRAPVKGFVASPAALQAVSGRYELFPGFAITFRVDGTNLVADVPGESSIPLTTESDSVYVNAQTGDAVEFLRDARGTITGASIDNNGGILLAKRLSDLAQ